MTRYMPDPRCLGGMNWAPNGRYVDYAEVERLEYENAQLKARLAESENAAYDVAGTIDMLKAELQAHAAIIVTLTQRGARLREVVRELLARFGEQNYPEVQAAWKAMKEPA